MQPIVLELNNKKYTDRNLHLWITIKFQILLQLFLNICYPGSVRDQRQENIPEKIEIESITVLLLVLQDEWHFNPPLVYDLETSFFHWQKFCHLEWNRFS